MTRFLALLIIALITFGIVIFVRKPEVVNNFWLWLVGFAGVIVRILQGAQNFAGRLFTKSRDLVVEEKNKLIGTAGDETSQ